MVGGRGRLEHESRLAVQRRTRACLPVGMTLVRAVAAPSDGSFTAWDTATQRVEKRTDIKTIMLLGAGPIVIGQVGRRWFSCQVASRLG